MRNSGKYLLVLLHVVTQHFAMGMVIVKPELSTKDYGEHALRKVLHESSLQLSSRSVTKGDTTEDIVEHFSANNGEQFDTNEHGVRTSRVASDRAMDSTLIKMAVLAISVFTTIALALCSTTHCKVCFEAGALEVSPETLYSYAMQVVLLGFLTSCVSTFGYVQPDVSEDPVITELGVMSICVAFDFSPAKEMMVVLWSVVQLLFGLHCLTHHMRIVSTFGSSRPWLVRASYVECLIFMLFQLQFVLTYQFAPKDSMIGHTLPYDLFVAGTALWWIWNWVVIETWPLHLDVDLWRWRALVMCMIAVSCVVILLHASLLQGHEFEPLHKAELPIIESLPSEWLRGFSDFVWMIIVALFPVANPLGDYTVSISLKTAEWRDGNTDGSVALHVPVSESNSL